MKNLKVKYPVNGTSALQPARPSKRSGAAIIAFPGAKAAATKYPKSVYAKPEPKLPVPVVRDVRPLELALTETAVRPAAKEDALCAGHPASRACTSGTAASKPAYARDGWRDAAGFHEVRDTLRHGTARGVALNVARMGQAIAGGVVLSALALSMVLLPL